MTRNEEQAALAKGVWCDSYNFYLKYHGRPADPGFWEEATADFGKIMKKYGGATVCGRLMLAAFSLLEEETRRMTKEDVRPGLLHLPEGDQWGCRVDQDPERDGIVYA